MGIIIVRKGGVQIEGSAKAFAKKLQKEIQYFGRNSGTIWEDGKTIRYARVGHSIIARVQEGIIW